ncbi:phosphate ABC transporter permease PstA [Ilumatobacter nonamiensis]|uniref:phosphate ABC transporter permease PstA n=1 Tax=Ilumatobacter nonamiensis TaxID=467093 RepID=UPI000346170C|nr:phosphate ABC transporter permease PstA [Ilumatobacter nonamiensis]
MIFTEPLVGDKTRESIRASITEPRADVAGRVFKALVVGSIVVTLLIVGILFFDQINGGWPQLSTRLGGFLQGTLRSRSEDELLGVHQALYGSLWIAIFVAVFAFPIGIAAAVYLEEYASTNRFTGFVELTIRNLAGVPSVVYGLLGLYLFVNDGWIKENITNGPTVISAGLTLAILVLPVVIITSQEALRSVPSGLKEGAYGVGATKWDVIRTQMLPYAAPGILTGTLLSMSRAIGEAAPLILIGAITGGLTANPGFTDVGALDDRFTAMPIIITTWVQQSGRDAGFAVAAAAAIVVLLCFVLLLNLAAILLRNRYENKRTV